MRKTSSNPCEREGNDVMNKITLRAIATLLGAVSCLSIGCASSAPVVTKHVRATNRTEFPAQFVARAISVSSPEDVGPIEIYVERWSTDDELGKLLGTLREGRPGELRTVLERQRVRAGVVLMPGVQGHGERVRTR